MSDISKKRRRPGREFAILDSESAMRFDLRLPVETNFNRYQDALEKHPEKVHQLKLRYDQYLKTVPLFNKEQIGEEQTDIEFDRCSSIGWMIY